MSFALVLNQQNSVANTGNSVYSYQFLSGNFTVKNSEMCLSQATIPYSFFNVNNVYGNTITFTWFSGSPITITLPTGFYSISDINQYLENYFILNNYYLINNTGQNVYFVNLFSNATYYANQLIIQTIPTSAQATSYGYTAPSGWGGYPSVATAPTISFALSGSISSLTGFTTGINYGGGTSNVSQLSQNVPLGSFVNSIVVRSNLVRNYVGTPTDILDSFPINSTFGSNINYTPSFQKWVDISDGTYSSFTISLFNEQLQPIVAQDNRSLLTLLIRKKTLL